MTKPPLSIILPGSLLTDVIRAFESMLGIQNTVTLFEADDTHYYGVNRADAQLDCQETLHVDGEIVGRVGVYGDSTNPILPRALQYLALTLSKLATETWRRKQLSDEVLERYDELNLIYGLGTSFVQGIPQDEIVKNVLEETNRIIQADAGVIYIWDNERANIKPVSYFGERSTPDFWEGRVRELALSTLYAYEQAQLFDADRVICAPLRYNDELLGSLLLLYEREDRSFRANDVNLLTALSHNTALFIYAARLVDKLAHEKSQLQTALDELQTALAELQVTQDKLAHEKSQLQETLTELQATQDKLSRAQRLGIVGQTVGSVVHDMRKPLGIIQGYATLLKGDVDTDERLLYAEQIGNYIEVFSSMAQEILDFTSGTINLQKVPVEVESFLIGVAQFLSPEGLERSIKLVVNVEKARGYCVNIDEVRFRRVFQNLYTNAADALETHGGTQVEIMAEPFENYIRFMVTDDGPGVPTEIIASLFDPFVTMGKSNGTGLGLAIVDSQITAHGGKIHYEAAPNGGARFVFTVPQCDCQTK